MIALSIDTVAGSAGPVVRLGGEADVASLDRLAHALDGLAGDVVLDCEGLAFVDVCVLDVLLATAARLRRSGGSLLIQRPPLSLLTAVGAMGHSGALTVSS